MQSTSHLSEPPPYLIDHYNYHYHNASHLIEGLVTHLTEDTHRMNESCITAGPEQTGSRFLEQHKQGQKHQEGKGTVVATQK